MKKIIGIIALIILLPALLIGQTTYYVSTAGGDSSDGSQGSPWRTIQHAVNNAMAGDIIQIAAGVYEEIITITQTLTLNGATGTIIRPPSNKGLGGAVISMDIVHDVAKGATDLLIIRGIEIDGNFSALVNSGIFLNNVDVLIEDVVIHGFRGDYDVQGILIENPGKTHITGCEIYDIGSMSSTLSVGIQINGESPILPGNSGTDGYDILIENNTIGDISSEFDQSLYTFQGARAIQIVNAGNVLVLNNVFSNVYQTEKAIDDNFQFGLWLESLSGENTIRGNVFSDLYVAVFLWATPILTFENNTATNCEHNVFARSNLPAMPDKSNDLLSEYNVRLPVISPGKSQKSFDTGRWVFSGNTISSTRGSFSSVVGIYIEHLPDTDPEKNGSGLELIISNNVVEKQIFGLIMANAGTMSCTLSENKIQTNGFAGFYCVNVIGGYMQLEIVDNDFLSNMMLGLFVGNQNTLNAEIDGNTIDGSEMGFLLQSALPFSANIQNNLIQSNEVGLDIESASFENVLVHNNRILNNAIFGINATLMQGPAKNNLLPLDASCNWWGMANSFHVQGSAKGDVNVFPFLLTDITDPAIIGYDCGGGPPPVPLSNAALLIAMMLMAGFMVFRFWGRS